MRQKHVFQVGVFCLIVIANLKGMQSDITEKDWSGKVYQNNSTLQYQAAMSIVEKIPFEGCENVLDIGCGDGRITKEIAKKVPQGSVHGIDFSGGMIQYAQQVHGDILNLSFEQADIAAYSSRKNYYNVVTAFASLGWVKDKQKAFDSISQVCASNAKVYIAGMHEEGPYLKARLEMLIDDKWKQFFKDYEFPFYPFNENKMDEYLRNAGLICKEIRKITKSYVFSSREEFLGWLYAIPLQYDCISTERQEEFLSDMIDKYLEYVPQNEDGSIELQITGLFVVAEKQ